MQAFINDQSVLGAAINQTFTAQTAAQSPATGIIVNRAGFYSADILVPYHATVAIGNTLGIGLQITESDTSTLSGSTAYTLLATQNVATGITGTTTFDGILKYGIDARQYHQYVKIQPIAVFSATATDTCTLGEIIYLTDPYRSPNAG